MPKDKDATQNKGVSDETKDLQPDTQEETQEKEKTVDEKMSERDLEIENMAKRLEKERDEEAGIVTDEKADEETGEGEEETPEESEEEDKEEPEETEEETEEETVEITVDGEKKTVLKSDVFDHGIRALQKESAADARLEKAVKLLEEAKKTTSKEKESETDGGKETTTEEDFKELSKEIDKKKIAEIREAIQYGDEEEADKAFTELIGLVTTTTRLPKNVMTVEDYEKKEQEKQEKQIIDKFSLPPKEGGFKDIMDDPYLFAAVNVEVNKELAKGTPNGWDLYKSAGDKVREWRGTPKDENHLKKEAEKKAKDDLAEKRDKKAKAASATKSVNAKTTTTKKTEDKKESPQDIVMQMKKERGQLI